MENIDYFNKYTARVLGALYKAFPQPLQINHAALAEDALGAAAWEPDIAQGAALDISRDAADYPRQETSEYLRQQGLAWHTVQWLRQCHYIRTDDVIDVDRRTVCRYVLSPKGFEVLAAVPEGVHPSHRLGERLAEAGKGAAEEAGRAATAQVVGAAIGAAIRIVAGTP